jgi:hypothetical protein
MAYGYKLLQTGEMTWVQTLDRMMFTHLEAADVDSPERKDRFGSSYFRGLESTSAIRFCNHNIQLTISTSESHISRTLQTTPLNTVSCPEMVLTFE